MTMRERIEEGKLFTDNCEGLPEERNECRQNLTEFNVTSPANYQEQKKAMEKLFGKETNAFIDPPFYCGYGKNITLGDKSYINVNCNFIDDGKIIVGEKVMFGPAVTIATVGHPINPDMRKYMYTAPVVIEDRVWVGAAVTICPGVTIGKNSVIGAGSVVVRDIPPNSVAVGNPCKVIREIGQRDKEFYFRDRPILDEDLEEERQIREADRKQ